MKKIGVLLCLLTLTTAAFAQTGKKAAHAKTIDRLAVERVVTDAELEMVRVSKIERDSLNSSMRLDVKKNKQVALELFRAVDNYQKMASENTPAQTGMILPAIARVADAYLADRENTKAVAKQINKPVTFQNGAVMSMTRYIDEYASETDGLESFKTALEEDLKVATKKSAGQVKFEEEIAGFNGNANFIGQYVLINLADPMRNMTDEEATPLAKEYVNYQVKGVSLVEFCKNPGVNWHQSALDELAAFGERVERLAK